jgi:uncharacterized protein YnzC (UPF0291/DUF896 family)
MSSTSIVIDIPNSLYATLQSRACGSNRTVQEEAIRVMQLVLPDWPEPLRSELNGLANLSDDELWAAARTTASSAMMDRLEELSFKRGDEGLTAAEKQEQERWLEECRRIMLVRAHAAVLLKDRGFDISSLGPER